MNLLRLPSDALMHILLKLPGKDLLSVSATCHALHSIANQHILWRNLCRRWGDVVDISDWLEVVRAPKNLYRILCQMSQLVGVWAAIDLPPRGGLVCIVWEKLSLCAYRVRPDWLDGSLHCSRLFVIRASSDGSTDLGLVEDRGVPQELAVELPGILVWESSERTRFHLERILPSLSPLVTHVPGEDAAASLRRSLSAGAMSDSEDMDHHQGEEEDGLVRYRGGVVGGLGIIGTGTTTGTGAGSGGGQGSGATDSRMAALRRMARPSWLARAARLLPRLAAAQVGAGEPAAGAGGGGGGAPLGAASVRPLRADGEGESEDEGMDGRGEGSGGGEGFEDAGVEEGREMDEGIVTGDGEGVSGRERQKGGDADDVAKEGWEYGDDDDAGVSEIEEDEYADAEGGVLAEENAGPTVTVQGRTDERGGDMHEGDEGSDEGGMQSDGSERIARDYNSSRHAASLNLRALHCLANFTEPEPATASTDAPPSGAPVPGECGGQVGAQEVGEREDREAGRDSIAGSDSSHSLTRKRRADGGDSECRAGRGRSGSGSGSSSSNSKEEHDSSQLYDDVAGKTARLLVSEAAGSGAEGDGSTAQKQQQQGQDNQLERQAAVRSAFEVVTREEEVSGPGGGPVSAVGGGGRAALSLWGVGGFSLRQSGDAARQWDGVVRRLRVPGSCYSKLPVDLTGMGNRVDGRASDGETVANNRAQLVGENIPGNGPAAETSLFHQGMNRAGPQVRMNGESDAAEQQIVAAVVAPAPAAAAAVVAPAAVPPGVESNGAGQEPGHRDRGMEVCARSMEGLWAGVFGPHGVEILHTRVVNGELLATKIIGDPNVPCGEVSFRAALDSLQGPDDAEFQRVSLLASSLLAFDEHRQPVPFACMYDGAGRIADYNFQRPQWVTGKLLLDTNNNLSFLWQDLPFVVRLRPLDFQAIMK